MAFPQTAAATETQFTAETTAHAVSIPSSNSGDWLFIHLACRNAGTFTGPDGWEILWEHTPVAAGFVDYAAYHKVADGTEVTANIVTSVTTAAAAQAKKATAWFGSLTGVEIGTIVGGTDDKPDPPSLTASWGAEDTLWIAVFGAEDDEAVVNIYPANYVNTVDTVSGLAGGQGATVGVATRENNTATENPGLFDLNKTENWGAQTIAIRARATAPPGLQRSLFAHAQRRSTLLRM